MKCDAQLKYRPSHFSTTFCCSMPTFPIILHLYFSFTSLCISALLLATPPPFLTVKLSVWGLVINCPVWLCIWPMPTHGRSLRSGSIDELTLKNDSTCLAQTRGVGGRERWGSKCVCLGVALRTEGSMSSNVSVCACVFGGGGGLSGYGGWKAKVFKGDGICRHAYCNTVSCSY